jgi:hypothetical protein
MTLIEDKLHGGVGPRDTFLVMQLRPKVLMALQAIKEAGLGQNGGHYLHVSFSHAAKAGYPGISFPYFRPMKDGCQYKFLRRKNSKIFGL